VCSGAAVTVAAEQRWRFGRMDSLSSQQAGWRLKPFNSQGCFLAAGHAVVRLEALFAVLLLNRC